MSTNELNNKNLITNFISSIILKYILLKETKNHNNSILVFCIFTNIKY